VVERQRPQRLANLGRPDASHLDENPGVKRTAYAEEAGTTVLAVGAKPGETFTPSAWELRWTSS
jgi:hypothetical protein